jgi:hypothetical protein
LFVFTSFALSSKAKQANVKVNGETVKSKETILMSKLIDAAKKKIINLQQIENDIQASFKVIREHKLNWKNESKLRNELTGDNQKNDVNFNYYAYSINDAKSVEQKEEEKKEIGLEAIDDERSNGLSRLKRETSESSEDPPKKNINKASDLLKKLLGKLSNKNSPKSDENDDSTKKKKENTKKMTQNEKVEELCDQLKSSFGKDLSESKLEELCDTLRQTIKGKSRKSKRKSSSQRKTLSERVREKLGRKAKTSKEAKTGVIYNVRRIRDFLTRNGRLTHDNLIELRRLLSDRFVFSRPYQPHFARRDPYSGTNMYGNGPFTNALTPVISRVKKLFNRFNVLQSSANSNGDAENKRSKREIESFENQVNYSHFWSSTVNSTELPTQNETNPNVWPEANQTDDNSIDTLVILRHFRLS